MAKNELQAMISRWAASGNEDEGQLQLRFLGGRTVKTAKIAAAPIILTGGLPDRLFALAAARVALVHETHPVAVVRVQPTGASHPVDSVTIRGGSDEPDEEEDELPDGAAGLWTATAKVVALLARSNKELLDQSLALAQQRQDLAVESTALLVHSLAVESSDAGERTARIMTALGPTLQAVAPAVVQHLLSSMRQPAAVPGPTAPAGPPAGPPTVAQSLDQIEASATDLVAALAGLPGDQRDAALAQIRDRLGPLISVMAQFSAGAT